MMYRLMVMVCALWLHFGYGLARAHDIEVTLRLHESKVQFLDPLFIEVTLVNKGREPITVDKPEVESGTLSVRFEETKLGISILSPRRGGFGYKPPKVTLEPNRPVVVRDYLFLPGVRWRQHKFWSHFARSSLYVSVEFRPDGYGVAFNSESVLVDLNYRDDEETRAILSELDDNIPFDRNTITPVAFDLPLNALTHSRKSRALEKRIERGGLKDILLLVAHMQEILEHDAAARKEAEQRLVAWLLERPNVKGRVLTEKALAVARQYRLMSTVEALGRIELDTRDPFDH